MTQDGDARVSLVQLLLSRLSPRHGHSAPAIEGVFQLELRERGKLITRRHGKNICTLTGREFFAESTGLQAVSPRTRFRSDNIAYIGMGIGTQLEVPEIASLVDPVPYRDGEYLAALNSPATFPTSGTATTATAVQFRRTFSEGELSLGYNLVITEAGLFTDGDPDNDWDTSSTPTDFPTASGRAPMFYKTYEPVTKTTDRTLGIIWDVRFV